MSMKKYLSIITIVLLSAGCMEFSPLAGDYDDPAQERIYTEEDLGDMPRKTIAEVKSMYVDGPVNFTEEFYIKGQITTSDRVGNFYREFYIQDESAGIAIKVGKTGLYNSYKQGQWIYVLCKGLTIGDYEGAKQIGVEDITGEYESAYIDIQMLIDRHVLKGEMGEPVQPLDLRGKSIYEGGVSENYLGKLVTIDGLKYAEGIFCLMYVDPNLNHKRQSNRIFLDEAFSNYMYPGGPPFSKMPSSAKTLKDGSPLRENWNVDTWAMTKQRQEWYLANGNFDYASIASDDNAFLAVDGNKAKVKSSAYSVSQYFQLTNESSKKYIAIRSSGYAKFADTMIPDKVLGVKRDETGKITNASLTPETITVTGILGIYDGDPQITLIDLNGVLKSDGETPWYNSDGSVNE